MNLFDSYVTIKEMIFWHMVMDFVFFILILWMITANKRTTTIIRTPKVTATAINGDKNTFTEKENDRNSSE